MDRILLRRNAWSQSTAALAEQGRENVPRMFGGETPGFRASVSPDNCTAISRPWRSRQHHASPHLSSPQPQTAPSSSSSSSASSSSSSLTPSLYSSLRLPPLNPGGFPFIIPLYGHRSLVETAKSPSYFSTLPPWRPHYPHSPPPTSKSTPPLNHAMSQLAARSTT